MAAAGKPEVAAAAAVDKPEVAAVAAAADKPDYLTDVAAVGKE
jgi:hypothetical protein